MRTIEEVLDINYGIYETGKNVIYDSHLFTPRMMDLIIYSWEYASKIDGSVMYSKKELIQLYEYFSKKYGS